MAIFNNPYDFHPRYVGAVIRTWEAEYDDPVGSFQYATAWDAASQEFVEVGCGEVLDLEGTQPFEDATKDILDAWNALPQPLREEPVPPVLPHSRMQVYRWRSSVQPEPAVDRFGSALGLASRLHRRQFRKGTRIPYVSHLLAVASLVLEHGGTEDESIAAVLHDTIEDQGGKETGELIRRRFGEEVYAIVAGCSDTDIIPKPPWLERKKGYIKHLKAASPSVKLVSAADKVHNARSMLNDLREHGEKVWDRFNAPKADQLWLYAELIAAFRAGDLPKGTASLVDELERVVRDFP